MDDWCLIALGVLGTLVALYALLDVHYFLRMCVTIVGGRLFGKRLFILDEAHVTGICLTNDLDTLFFHMNNARYLREIDFARADFYERSRLYRTICATGGSVVQGATTVRYRRFIRPFRTYRITSKIVYWDESTIFMEHLFVSPRDGFVHCVAVCRQRLIECSAERVMEALMKECDGGGQQAKLESGGGQRAKPELTLELSKWIDYNNLSSSALRQKGC